MIPNPFHRKAHYRKARPAFTFTTSEPDAERTPEYRAWLRALEVATLRLDLGADANEPYAFDLWRYNFTVPQAARSLGLWVYTTSQFTVTLQGPDGALESWHTRDPFAARDALGGAVWRALIEGGCALRDASQARRLAAVTDASIPVTVLAARGWSASLIPILELPA